MPMPAAPKRGRRRSSAKDAGLAPITAGRRATNRNAGPAGVRRIVLPSRAEVKLKQTENRWVPHSQVDFMSLRSIQSH